MAGTSLQAAVTSTIKAREVSNDTGDSLILTGTCTGGAPSDTTAGRYAPGCMITRTDGGAAASKVYQNTGTAATPVWTLMDTALPGDTATTLIDTNGNTTVSSVVGSASAVNYLTATNSATGAVAANAVTLSAAGTDAAVSIAVAPKGVTGITTIGLSTGTGDVVVGSSSGAQSVKVGNGAGVSTVNLANTSVAGANLNVATAATGAGITDTVNISTGNAAATGIKVVNILTGTPGTAGNNRLTMGGTVADSRATIKADLTTFRAPNYIATETGANNAIVGALTDASGTNVPAAAGLRVTVKLAHTLQAGANTFNFNAGGAESIKKHTNAASDLGTAYAATGIIELMYDGSAWLDMSQ